MRLKPRWPHEQPDLLAGHRLPVVQAVPEKPWLLAALVDGTLTHWPERLGDYPMEEDTEWSRTRHRTLIERCLSRYLRERCAPYQDLGPRAVALVGIILDALRDYGAFRPDHVLHVLDLMRSEVRRVPGRRRAGRPGRAGRSHREAT